MAYRFTLDARAEADLDDIARFLVRSHLRFGESLETARTKTAKRLNRIEAALYTLAKAPHQGTLREDILPGLRSVTKERAIIYFTLDDDTQTLRVIALFFGGQDHQRAMILRILNED